MNLRPAASSCCRLALAVSIACGGGAAFAQSATGPTSRLYVETSNLGSLFIVQGTSVIAGPQPAFCNYCESTIAVDGDIRSLAQGGFQGGKYNLDLTQTSTTYAGYGFFSDGATDGSHNYAAGNDVYVFARDWSSPSILFHASVPLDLNGNPYFVEGITYDPTNNSLWIASDDQSVGTSVIQDYSLTGTLLSSFFAVGVNGLALDYADGTLWTIRGPGHSFDQYSKTGQRLQSITYASLDGGLSTVGIEFDLAGDARVVDPNTVPEPDLAALAGVGLAAWYVARRRPAKPVANSRLAT